MTLGQLKNTAAIFNLPDSTILLIGIELPGLPAEFTRISVSEQVEHTLADRTLGDTLSETVKRAPEEESLENPNALVLWVEVENEH